MPPRLHLIYARAANGVIGRDGALPWYLPQDMTHFRQLTTGAPVVMGRKTWDSLPERFRPLPGRRNIVATRQENWREKGAQRASSLQEALSFCEPEEVAWVIGGAQIYHEALPLAHRIEVTEIARDYEGDALAPELDATWIEVAREAHTTPEGLGFSFVRYERRPP